MKIWNAIATVLFVCIIAVYLLNPFGVPSWHIVERLAGRWIYKMPATSMEPAIAKGSYFWVCHGVSPSDLKVGDVVLFPNPVNPVFLSVMRIAGLGGSTIAIENGVVILDNKQLAGMFVSNGDLPPQSRRFEPFSVPASSVFLLGDNLNHSNDSRFFGPVPLSAIRAKTCKEV